MWLPTGKHTSPLLMIVESYWLNQREWSTLVKLEVSQTLKMTFRYNFIFWQARMNQNLLKGTILRGLCKILGECRS